MSISAKEIKEAIERSRSNEISFAEARWYMKELNTKMIYEELTSDEEHLYLNLVVNFSL